MLDFVEAAFAYVCECAVVPAVIAKGLVIHPESFMRNGWNLIDSVVVISG